MARLSISYAIDHNGVLTVRASSAVQNQTEVMQVYSQDGRIPRTLLTAIIERALALFGRCDMPRLF